MTRKRKKRAEFHPPGPQYVTYQELGTIQGKGQSFLEWRENLTPEQLTHMFRGDNAYAKRIASRHPNLPDHLKTMIALADEDEEPGSFAGLFSASEAFKDNMINIGRQLTAGFNAMSASTAITAAQAAKIMAEVANQQQNKIK